MDFQFAQPESLIWLWVAAAAAGLLALAAVRRRRSMARLATANLQSRFERAIGPTRRGVRAILLIAAMVAIVAGLLDPRWGVRLEHVAQRNIDTVFVLDTSQSMLAEDLRPNRLERAKQYIGDVLDTAVGDRFGLVIYGGTPTLKVPLTRDTTAMRMALDEIGPRTGRRGGSMMGDAIRLAEESLSVGDEGYRAIIVLSDGDDMGSYPDEAAASAAKGGIAIWTIGLGDATEGARIPMEVDGQRIYLTWEGEEVWSKMNASRMSEVAAAADGQFIPAGTANLDLADIYDRVIAPASGRRVDSARVERYIPRYRWFVAGALVLLALESLAGLALTRPRPIPRPWTPPPGVEEVTA